MGWISENWLTLVPLIGGGLAWVYASFMNARTLRRDQKEREWRRFHELVATLYNGREEGYWRQIAALHEMLDLPAKSRVTRVILTDALAYFSRSDFNQSDGSPAKIVGEIERALGRIE